MYLMRLLSSVWIRKKPNPKVFAERLYSINLEFKNIGDSKASHRLGKEHTYIKLLLTEYYVILKTAPSI